MDYTQNIQNTISYIEQHLCEKLSLDELSKISGFSKYHFLRIFKHETGRGLWEHIKNRRMSQAAKLIISTELNIMDIALMFQFESQEAFTRAFKREYSLPPGKYRRVMSQLIKVKETHTMNRNKILGWIVTGSAPKAYKADLDQETIYNGKKSVSLTSFGNELEAGDYGTVMQQFKAENYIGKRVRLSGFIKSKDVTGWGGLWMRINSTTANIVKLDNMQNRPIQGTTDWNYYSVVLDIPENSAIINIGMLLYGSGQLWLDNISFEIVDKHVRTTDVDLSCDLPEGPVNLSFNEV